MITSRRQQPLSIIINNRQWAYTRLVPFESSDFIPCWGIIDDEVTVFSTNSDLVAFDLNATEYDVGELNGFEVALIREGELLAPLESGGLLGGTDGRRLAFEWVRWEGFALYFSY